jgi:hypothetical protein
MVCPRKLIALLAVPLLFACGCHKHGSVSGSVIDARTKEPIPGARINAYSYVEPRRSGSRELSVPDFTPMTPDGKTKTDSRGFFRVKYNQPLMYFGYCEGPVVPGIRVEADGYETFETGGIFLDRLPIYPEKQGQCIRIFALSKMKSIAPPEAKGRD